MTSHPPLRRKATQGRFFAVKQTIGLRRQDRVAVEQQQPKIDYN
ncbi:hypothetical protein [Candidatus Enterococcus leclercqii]|nr:hypothetical protein [Enterococcus sp. CU9D]